MSHKGKKKSNVYSSEVGYDLYAKFYDKSTRYLDSFEKDVLKILIPDLKGKRVLDLGAGTGRLIPYLRDQGAEEIYASDVSKEMLQILKRKFPQVQIHKTEPEKLPFENDFFDVVIAAFVVVHLSKPDKFFDEVYRILKDGGIFILTNINQRKGPKLRLDDRSEIVIKSFYHRPVDIIKSLKNSLFYIQKEKFVEEQGVWVNQIIRATK